VVMLVGHTRRRRGTAVAGAHKAPRPVLLASRGSVAAALRTPAPIGLEAVVCVGWLPGLESLIRLGAGRILGIRASPRGKEGDDMADGAVVSLGPNSATTAGVRRRRIGVLDRRPPDGSVAGLTPNGEDGRGVIRSTAVPSASGIEGADHTHPRAESRMGFGMNDDDTVRSLDEEQRRQRCGPPFRRSSGRRPIVTESGHLTRSGSWRRPRMMWRIAVARRWRLRLGV
jgi:hypothetical protein